MAWAIEQRRVTDPAARHILLLLGNYADKHGRNAFPSIATLAHESGWSERTVQAKINLLIETGVIRTGNRLVVAAEIARADRRPVVYDLDMPRGAGAAPRGHSPAGRERGETDAPREDERGAGAAPCGCERGADDGVNGVQMRAPRGAGAAPEPKSNRKATEREARVRGTRLPPEWEPGQQGRAYATERGIDPSTELESFRDHWQSATGAEALKADWDAAWRTWVRRAVSWRAKHGQAPATASPRHAPASEVLERARAKKPASPETAAAAIDEARALLRRSQARAGASA